LQQHRNIKVGGATLECTLYGSGIPVVLLANAGCSTGYFDDLARVLAAGGLQTISVNMRGTGESRGSLDGISLPDLAVDVAEVLEAMDCGPAHLVGHAFGNRVARCLAAARPSAVRSVTLLAAGGLIGPSTPLGDPFRSAIEAKMSGSDCVTVLGARWLSPASDPKILAHVECWPAVHLAHLATSRGVVLEEWWGAGEAPLLVIQGLDDEAAPPGNGHALRKQFGERVRVIDLPRAGHFLPLEQPEAVTRAVAEFVGAAQSRADRLREIESSRNVALHANAKMLRLKLDPAKAVPAMISYQYDENADPEASYEGRTWPTEDGFAYIICRDCGELDEEGQFFEKNTVYTTRGDFTAHPDERCNVCMGYGFLRVGL
jgi:pimeloyl-ACP methyl ester carboxylesterase